MAHFSHPRKLPTDIACQALARIRSTGALVYCQAPMIARVNDGATACSEFWRAELGSRTGDVGRVLRCQCGRLWITVKGTVNRWHAGGPGTVACSSGRKLRDRTSSGSACGG
jgi:hypothetical protein